MRSKLRRPPTAAARRLPVTALALAACLVGTSGTAAAVDGPVAVPPRDRPGVRPLSDAQLWKRAFAPAAAAHDGAASFVVGLKARGENRGIWRDRVLIDRVERRRAERRLVATPGVLGLRRDAALPAVTVTLRDMHTLSLVRRLGFVD